MGVSLTLEEALALPSTENLLDSIQGAKVGAYRLPCDSGFKSLFAKSIADAFTGIGDVVFFIIERDVWPSAEMPSMLPRIRQSEGREPSLDDYPADLCSSSEKDYLANALAIALYCYWEFAVITKGVTLVVSHDEWLNFIGNNEKEVQSWHQWLDELEVEKISASYISDLYGDSQDEI